MKRKFSKILGVGLALVLALSLSLVMAVPIAADIETWDGVEFETRETGTAEWTAKDPPGAFSGYHCVKLTCSGSGLLEWTAAKVAYGETMATLVALTKPAGAYTVLDVEFNYYATSGGGIPYAMLWIDEDADGTIDTRLTGGFDVREDGTPGILVYDQWVEWYKTDPAAWQLRDYDDGIVTTYSGGYTGDDWNVYLSNYVADEDCENAIVEYIGVGYTANADPAYVDDITIGGVAYAMEPPLPPLDEAYYSVGDQPTVTIYDGAANVDPMAIDIIEIPDTGHNVLVVSGTDTIGDDLELTETEGDSGVFTGSFTLLGAAPADREADEIVVSEGDTITLTYSYLGLSVTALVDDTAPTITVPEPLVDGATTDDRTPDIKATYADSGSGINTDSVEIIFNGVDVTDDTTPTSAGVTYTPEDALDDGSYDVMVNVSDNAGNAATPETWSFRVVSWLVEPESATAASELDELDAVGVAVSITGTTGDITVGRYASNPEPDAALTFTTIEDGFFDVKVTTLVGTATQIVIKFAATGITAESTAHVWYDLEGAWLECSDQGYNSLDEYLWVKVRTDTIPNIAELEGTPFAIGGEEAPPEFDPWVYDDDGDDVMEITEVLEAISDYFDDEITITQVLEVITLYF